MWTKWLLFFSAKDKGLNLLYYICLIKLNGSKLCWGATCQG